jgi:uncharacterized protein (TIGR02453 family)
MSPAGIPADAVAFYAELEADNTRDWWTANKERYERSVREPFIDLTDALADEFGEARIFRPYRDVRFSADKTPYKSHCGATAGPYYLQVGADGLMAAGGYYQMASDQVARFRTAVDDERRGGDLEKRLAAVRADGITVGGEQLKTRPRGVDPEHPRLELLRHKGLYGWRRWPPDDTLHEAGTLARVAGTWRSLQPLIEWLADHVGPSDQPRR